MHRRLLVQQVMDELRTSDERVAYPDHPLLLSGPDVLALMRGVLTAYFVYNGRGQRPSSGRERSRYVLSRLALPPGTRCVLVVDPTVNEDLWAHAILLDDIVTVRDLAMFARSAGHFELGDSADLIESIRDFHNARFAEAWTRAFQVPTDVRRRAERPGEPTSESAAHRSRSRRAHWMAVDNGVIYARAPGQTGQAVRRAIAQTTAAATTLDYDLDLGLSGLAETSAKLRSGNGHLAIHHFAGERATSKPGFDVFKPQRAAAFAGIEADGFQELG